MIRGDFFLLCVQTSLLLRKVTAANAMKVLQKAGELDDAAYGGEADLANAADHFVHSVLDSRLKKPSWLDAWEEGLKNRVQIMARDAAETREWWLHAEEALIDSLQGRGVPFPRELDDLVYGRVRGLIVSQSQATQFETWGQSIPGWDQRPFTFEEPK